MKTTNEYCFRLQIKDACGNETISNEVCTIKPTATIISDKVAKLDWTIPDPNVTQYVINYSESPTGANAISTLPATKTANSYTLNTLDCKKKYDLYITASIGTLATTIVTIKSPIILIDISSIKELLTPNDFATVSVLDSKRITYNLFNPNPSDLKSVYLFFRAENGGEFIQYKASNQNVYLDNDADLDKNQYCYAFKYQSACGVSSAFSTHKPCVVKLTMENSKLKWTPFSISTNTIAKPEYSVEALDNNNKVIAPLITTAETTFDILDILNNNSKNISKFRIYAKIIENIGIDNVTNLFPFAVYSNTINLPILSTSNESEILNIYPNPSEEIIQFSTTFQLKTAEIVDLQGKIVENQAIEENQVSVKNLPKGKYILRLYDQEKRMIINKTIVRM